MKNLKSVNIWQSYKQERVMYFARLANTLLKTKESSSEKKFNIGLTELWSWVWVMIAWDHITADSVASLTDDTRQACSLCTDTTSGYSDDSMRPHHAGRVSSVSDETLSAVMWPHAIITLATCVCAETTRWPCIVCQGWDTISCDKVIRHNKWLEWW